MKLKKLKKRMMAALCLAFVLCLAASAALPAKTCVFAAAQAAEKVSLNKTRATIYNGQTLQLKLMGTSDRVAWSSSARSVATVNRNGKVTAKKAGTANITAKVGNVRYTCRLTVKPALSLKKSALSVNAGDSVKVGVTYPLKGTVTCKSSEPSVAACAVKLKDRKYRLVVTGRKAGRAIITLSNSLTKDKASLTVTVNAAGSERMELYGYLGQKSLDALEAALTDKLTAKPEGRYTNAGLSIGFFADDEGLPKMIRVIELLSGKAADAYEICGVHNGMTRAEADKALKAFGFEFDTDWGPEDGVEYWGDDKAGVGCVFSYWYDGDIVRDLYLRY